MPNDQNFVHAKIQLGALQEMLFCFEEEIFTDPLKVRKLALLMGEETLMAWRSCTYNFILRIDGYKIALEQGALEESIFELYVEMNLFFEHSELFMLEQSEARLFALRTMLQKLSNPR